MQKFGFLGSLKAKPGKEQAVGDFLKSALPLAHEEPGTIRCHAFQLNADTFGIFDTFEDEAGRDTHFHGEIAKALFANADELLAVPPTIEKLDLLAVK